jgi:hypothetical protein
MPRQPLFAGLVVDEFDRVVETAFVGDDPCYVVDDAGFRRHILADQVDRQVLEQMRSLTEGHENVIGAQMAKMLGQEDIFSVAMIENQLKNIDKQFDALLEVGIPEEARAYLGMAGFKVVIDVHGDVKRIDQPAGPEDGDGDEGGE